MTSKRTALLARFVATHRDRAVRVAFRMGAKDQAAAEDLVQDAFVRAHTKLQSLRDPSQMKAWFYRILMRQAVSSYRRQGVRDRHRDNVAVLYPASTTAPSSDPALQKRVVAAVERLTLAQRSVVVLVYLEQFTLNEAAEILGSAPGTVRSHLHRALKSLRSDLAVQLEEYQ